MLSPASENDLFCRWLPVRDGTEESSSSAKCRSCSCGALPQAMQQAHQRQPACRTMSWQPPTKCSKATFLWHMLMLPDTLPPVHSIAGNAAVAPRTGHAANASAPASVHTDELASASQPPAQLSSVQVAPVPRQAFTAATSVPAPAPVLAQADGLASTAALPHGTAGSATVAGAAPAGDSSTGVSSSAGLTLPAAYL